MLPCGNYGRHVELIDLNRRRSVLISRGYSFEVYHDKYKVSYRGEFVGAAGTVKDTYNPKPKHHSRKRADYRDNLLASIITAERHWARVSA